MTAPSDASPPAIVPDAKKGSLRALKAVNFFIADVQNGMGPYMALFLQSSAGWGPAQIGSALAAGNIAQVLAQAPAGALIDNLRQKRALLIVSIGLIMTGMLGTAFFTVWPVVMGGQALVGIAGAFFRPAWRPLRWGWCAASSSTRCRAPTKPSTRAVTCLRRWRWARWATISACAGCFCSWRCWAWGPSLASCASRPTTSISMPPAAVKRLPKSKTSSVTTPRPRPPAAACGKISNLLACLADLIKQPPVRVFLVAAVVFHFANAAMVPLVTQLLARGVGAQQAVLFTSGYVLASQLVVVVVAAASGKLAGKVGRKPLLLFAFAALAARGVLYTMSHHPAALIAVQCMDGLGAGIFGVVGVLIIADLTKGTGRFNAAQGAIATAQGIGAFLSNSVAGYLAKTRGDDFTFYVLAAIAVAGFVLFLLFMPETREAAAEPGAKLAVA